MEEYIGKNSKLIVQIKKLDESTNQKCVTCYNRAEFEWNYKVNEPTTFQQYPGYVCMYCKYIITCVYDKK